MNTHDQTIRRAPEFLCVGIQKSGTGWLYESLSAHKQVSLPLFKEIGYFSQRTSKQKYFTQAKAILENTSLKEHHRFASIYLNASQEERESQEWYESLFGCLPNGVSGDISPSYSKLSLQDIDQVKVSYPSLKIILLIRHPLDRIISNLQMGIRKGKFVSAVLTSPAAFAAQFPRAAKNKKNFPTQVWSDWHSVFGENCKYWTLDEISEKPDFVKREVAGFLNIDPRDFSQLENENRKANLPKVTPSHDVVKYLYELFEDEIHLCENVFKNRCPKSRFML